MENKFEKRQNHSKWGHSAKECAYLAVFVALLIAMQLVLSAVPGVELVTVMFVAYAYVMGAKRGMLAATAFSLLRQAVFGVFPKVFVLNIIYFNLLALCFGLLGHNNKNMKIWFPILIIIACIATACFTMFDNILTPIWLGYSQRDARLYFKASLPFMIPQIVCTALTVTFLFLPLRKIFNMLKKSLQIR